MMALLYGILGVGKKLNKRGLVGILGRGMVKLSSLLLQRRIGDTFDFEFEGVSLKYRTDNAFSKWWFAVRHKIGEVHEAPVTRQFIRVIHPGDVVFDVGTAIGHYTLIAASLVGFDGVVHCFDVDRDMLALLSGNVQINGFQDRCRINRKYVAAKTVTDVDPEKIGLDDYCVVEGITPDVIKMDIEGGEMDALQGARVLFEQGGPDLICEVHPAYLKALGYDYKDFIDALLGYRYAIFLIPDMRVGKADTTLIPIKDAACGENQGQFAIYATKKPGC